MSHTSLELSPVPKFYCSYLVRLWQDDDQLPWRASAQSVQTGTTLRFADLDSLFAFLAREAGLQERGSEPSQINQD